MNILKFVMIMMILWILVLIFFKIPFQPKYFKHITVEPSISKVVTNVHATVDSISRNTEKKSQQRIVNKATDISIKDGGIPVYDFDRGLRPLEKPWAKTAEHQYARQFGAHGKISLLVVDSKSSPVEGADVSASFWNGDGKSRAVKTRTDSFGIAELAEQSIGDMVFQVNKPAYYQTHLRYWFSKPGYDCVKDGRWIPWNPTIEIILKEKRAPIPLYTREIESTFPKRENVGFDCIAEDFVKPYGKGTTADFYLKYESIVPFPAVTIRDWSYFTNSLILSVSGDGGFITKPKDTFSKMISAYEAPEAGYTDTINYGMKRMHDKIFMDRKLGKDEYFFSSPV